VSERNDSKQYGDSRSVRKVVKTEPRENVKKSNNKYFKNMEDKLGRRRPGAIEKTRKVGNEQRRTVSNLSEYCG
jgi:hypothetical protein